MKLSGHTILSSVLADRAKAMRARPGPGEHVFVGQFSDILSPPA